MTQQIGDFHREVVTKNSDFLGDRKRIGGCICTN